MKSFKEHINPNKEHINTNKREVLKETDPLDDLTAVLGIAAAGLGAWGLKKGWDRFGKDAVASIPFVGRLTGGKAGKAKREKERKDKKIADLKTVADTGDADAEKKLDKLLSPGEKEDRRKERLDKAKKDGDQATVDKLSTDDEKDQAKIDAADKEKKGKQTKADAELLDAPRDSAGNLEKQPDAQKSKEMTGKAPPGWATSPKKSPGKGEVWTTKDQEKWDADAEKRAASKSKNKKDQQVKDLEKKRGPEKPMSVMQMTPAQKAKKLADFKKKKAEAGKEEFQKFALHELISLTGENRIQLLEELVMEETMSLEESQELQAIMALDDAGIKADINRKGQVVIKKKDKKKAHIALEKSFKKGGWPPLKLEDVDEHKGTEPHKHPHEDEELDEASSKKARNKAADEIEKIADKGGAEAPTLFSLASKLRKGTHSTTGLKLSKQVTSILKDNGIKEEVDLNTYQEMKMSMAAKKKRALWAKTAAGKKSAKKSKIRAKKVRAGSIKIDKAKGRKMAMARKKGGIRDAYEIVSEARNRAKENKPEWETEDLRLS